MSNKVAGRFRMDIQLDWVSGPIPDIVRIEE